jgi:hypothetical protein
MKTHKIASGRSRVFYAGALYFDPAVRNLGLSNILVSILLFRIGRISRPKF